MFPEVNNCIMFMDLHLFYRSISQLFLLCTAKHVQTLVLFSSCVIVCWDPEPLFNVVL